MSDVEGSASERELIVGRIVGLFGVRGELKCYATNAARSLFKSGAEFRFEHGDVRGSVRLCSVREHQGRFLVTIEGIVNATAAEALVGATLLAKKAAIPLASGEYLDEDLRGCNVVTKDGKLCGTVERVEHYPASDMLVVGGKMIPMVSAIVLAIDTSIKVVTIDPPPGLLD
jgi:16S rRNA processing protein RimM